MYSRGYKGDQSTSVHSSFGSDRDCVCTSIESKLGLSTNNPDQNEISVRLVTGVEKQAM